MRPENPEDLDGSCFPEKTKGDVPNLGCFLSLPSSPGTLEVSTSPTSSNILFMTLGAQALTQDEFSKCFEPKYVFGTFPPAAWVASVIPTRLMRISYFFGVFIRYCILLPSRICIFLFSLFVFIVFLPFVGGRNEDETVELRKTLFLFLSKCWALSISAWIRHHGKKPVLNEPHVFVANHTSFVDFVLLSSNVFPHATVAQTHGGVFGYVQRYILSAIGSLSFQRNERKERLCLSERLKKHASNIKLAPILIFPEGTCVNNEYTVLFHKGSFELGVTVCPVAIKYNKTLLDPYWNTREQSFSQHALYIMSRWLLVADIWWLEPQRIGLNETSIQFANRVKAMISSQAGLGNLSWDGYLKNYMAHDERTKLIKRSQMSYGMGLKLKLSRVFDNSKVYLDASTLTECLSESESSMICNKGCRFDIDSVSSLPLFDSENHLLMESSIDVKNNLLKISMDENKRDTWSVSVSMAPLTISGLLRLTRYDLIRAWRNTKNARHEADMEILKRIKNMTWRIWFRKRQIESSDI